MKNPKPLSYLLMPLHLYFESDLETLHKAYERRGETKVAAEIAAELHKRQQETYHVEYGISPKRQRKGKLAKAVQFPKVTLTKIQTLAA